MGAGVQFAVGLVIGIALLAVGAAYVGRVEGAVRAVAALGCTALGLMLLADLMIVPALTLRFGNSLAPVPLQVGGMSLALLALVLILMGGFTGLAWAVRRHRLADLVLPCGAVVALVAGVAFTADSIFGLRPLATDAQSKAMALAGFGLGTLAAALVAFWAVPIVRRGAAAAGARSRDAA